MVEPLRSISRLGRTGLAVLALAGNVGCRSVAIENPPDIPKCSVGSRTAPENPTIINWNNPGASSLDQIYQEYNEIQPYIARAKITTVSNDLLEKYQLMDQNYKQLIGVDEGDTALIVGIASIASLTIVSSCASRSYQCEWRSFLLAPVGPEEKVWGSLSSCLGESRYSDKPTAFSTITNFPSALTFKDYAAKHPYEEVARLYLRKFQPNSTQPIPGTRLIYSIVAAD